MGWPSFPFDPGEDALKRYHEELQKALELGVLTLRSANEAAAAPALERKPEPKTTPPADRYEVALDQLESMLEHTQAGCQGCADCQLLRRVTDMLLDRFQ